MTCSDLCHVRCPISFFPFRARTVSKNRVACVLAPVHYRSTSLRFLQVPRDILDLLPSYVLAMPLKEPSFDFGIAQ